ncbi:MAG: hypothetical protein IPK16_26770 [Anaerolineales bacterium]|nr:hypothetical protein [Anaerolineales bacterium]
MRAIALQILNYFDDAHPECTLSEVATGDGVASGDHPPDHEATLANYGYLEKLLKTGIPAKAGG